MPSEQRAAVFDLALDEVLCQRQGRNWIAGQPELRDSQFHVLMGHADPSTLARVYQHLSQNPKYLLDQAKRARG